MKTLYAYKAYKGNGDIFFTEDQQLINSFKFLGTIEVKEPPKEKKWVKRTDLIPDGREGTMTHLPIRKYRNAVLTYEVEE